MRVPRTTRIGFRLTQILIGCLGLHCTEGRGAPSDEGLLGLFPFAGSFSNMAQASMALTNGGGTLTTDRFGRPLQALGIRTVGYVGSFTSDFLKERTNWTLSAWIKPDPS